MVAVLDELLTDPVAPKLEELELDVVPDPLVEDTAAVPDWLAYASAR